MNTYLIFKTIHIISVITWVAALFYLPRLFVYHSTKEIGSDASETFKVMESKLLKIIANPSLILVWIRSSPFELQRFRNLACSKNVSCHGHDSFSLLS